ncbi:NAD-dependent dehydratase [Rhodanobacter panaciterrae]|uniref:NAD-dependent dehydratase n=1 Tax=Rhodanobacter panaciterrae TaxID=490572 RepID=A0ABQ2ZGI6_9GAMM|nr:NAD-dependent epimerase/dehydratase family protein [Rhodanobacter panaciterrae]GGY15894.1 NAD-dependent dehydratase [Rhodanobacter panaciterrae]
MSDRILILGAGGFVGIHLARMLAERGEQVIAVSRQPIDLALANVEIVIGEPDESDHFLPLVKRSRAVIHTASRSTPGSSAGHAMAELQHNLRPTVALLQALQAHPQTNLLYLSSGGSLYATAPEELATESSPVRPRSYHGAGKIAAEHFIGAWCSQYGGGATILRPSNIYGPGQHERTGFGIVPTGLGKISRGETLTVWGDGSATRDYLYIEDFVALCIATLATPMSGGARVLNAASSVGVSLNELFNVMEAVTGRPLQRSYDTGRSVDTPRVVMDANLARQHYGWSATTSLHEGIANTWAWFNTILR